VNRIISAIKNYWNGPTLGIGHGLNDVEQAHVADIVHVNLRLQHDNKRLAIQLDGEDGGRK
jgi:hypothetical protein